MTIVVLTPSDDYYLVAHHVAPLLIGEALVWRTAVSRAATYVGRQRAQGSSVQPDAVHHQLDLAVADVDGAAVARHIAEYAR